MGLFDQTKDFLSSSGETLSDLWGNLSDLDKLALTTSPVPIIGDIVGGIADYHYISNEYDKTKEIPWVDVGLATTGLLPFLPPAIASRSIKKGLKSMGEKALKHAPNKLPGYYSSGRAQAAVRGAVKGGLNLLQSAYSPKAQGLWKKHGISLTDKKIMDKALKTSEKLSGQTLTKSQKVKASDVGKEVAGQINQTRLFNEQYKNRETLYDVLDGIDQASFSKFGKQEYNKIMKAATGLKEDTMSAIFRQMGRNQNIDINSNEWRMAIRRPYTGQASGNLRTPLTASRSKIYGGKNLTAVKEAFKNKKFKTNLELLNSLKKQNIKIVNEDKIRLAAKNGDDSIEVVLNGSHVTDAYELGGVNYLTVIKKDGNIVSFGNDANNLAAIKNIDINAPMADRVVSITTPMHINVLGKGKKGQSKKVQEAMGKLADESRDASKKALKNLGVKGPGKSLSHLGLNRPQSEFIRTVGNLQDKAYAPVAANLALTGVRALKPVERTGLFSELYF